MKLKEERAWKDSYGDSKKLDKNYYDLWLMGFEFAKSELKKKLHFNEHAVEIIDSFGEEEVE